MWWIIRSKREVFANSLRLVKLPLPHVRQQFANVIAVKDKMKICFDPIAQFPALHTERTAPRWLFFTEITGAGESRLNELTQTETMVRLMRLSLGNV